ncbi:RHS repeat-associated core domain-containing protein [Pseudomonas serboccidentalis]|uniref:RHS repeat-associated core domain-containing protein n=1 Tax=Pseudomonas serboccidentalis TaxID=2964670 RepID=A0ABY7Z2N5_9PSED|nr:RHS repeat-associated core domain-containing protein [Pseudomonas serboccidentalis]WDR33881.1 RHS repeat-associated core domain-containing protein [Pseudomonas serboccidentalis]
MNVHRRTPALTVHDSRGLPVRQVVYLRTVAEDTPVPLLTRQQHDVAGRRVAQWDPRLSVASRVTVYGLGGEPLKSDSVDAGMRLTLPGLAGEALERWDARGNHWRSSFDEQLRVLSVDNSLQPDRETFTYADASASAAFNLRGQLIAVHDTSGTLQFNSFGLYGEALQETRRFDDEQAFVTRRTYSPLGALLEQIDAGGHHQQLRYDAAGQLRFSQLRLSLNPDWQPVLQDAQYNAAGQIIEQRTDNGVVSRWYYDPADGRLNRQSSNKGTQSVLQDFEYVFDPSGNITRIIDHAFSVSHFANQRVDGERRFSYDSLYRLHSASGYDDGPLTDIPGLPQLTDPRNRLNYTQTYAYDRGNNLIRLSHVRDGASHTRQMFIDPQSNRGVRWQEGDPAPDFTSLFDRHGNLLALQPGQPLQWNARDQLAQVTLVQRDDGLHDREYYRYSQGGRIYKRHERYTTNVSHFEEVRYLSGLEIRRRDNGEELHIISISAGSGSVRCLHWVAGQPTGVDADQLRYTLGDHLGSCVMELDQQARLVSHEGYYPFGATAWMVGRSAQEVSYKTVRYSGKEMDVSGLYAYGARYYAPWLQRWVSTDPAGDADGLNPYGFVANNPLRYVDPDGNTRAESVIMLYSAFISTVQEHSTQVVGQIHSILHDEGVAGGLALNMAGEVVRGVIGYEGGVIGAGLVDLVAPNVPFTTPFTTSGGVVGGNIGGDAATAMVEPLANSARLRVGPLIPQTSQISVSAIDQGLGIEETVKEIKSWRDMKDELIHPGLNAVFNPSFVMGRLMASWISILPGAINMFARAIEAEDIKNRLDPMKVQKIETLLGDWKTAIEQRAAWAENAFDALGTDTVYPANSLPNVNHMTPAEALAPINRADLQRQTRFTLSNIKRAQDMMTLYKEMGTTDNQFLLAQRRVRKNAA